MMTTTTGAWTGKMYRCVGGEHKGVCRFLVRSVPYPPPACP
jgi:hypothetical protein